MLINIKVSFMNVVQESHGGQAYFISAVYQIDMRIVIIVIAPV